MNEDHINAQSPHNSIFPKSNARRSRKHRPQTRRHKRAKPAGLLVERLEDRRLLAGNGLLGQYYHNADLTDAAITRVDPGVDFDWGAGSPNAAIANDTFSARWTGAVEANFTETYNFHISADDGARLWLNGQLLIDQFDATNVDQSAAFEMIAGRRYDVQLEYREQTGNASVNLEWSSPRTPIATIPSSNLFSDSRGLTVERFDSVTGSTVADLTSSVNFPATPTSVALNSSFESTDNTGEQFGQRLSGYLLPQITGRYTFYLAADQSAELWLSNSHDVDAKEQIADVNSATLPQQWDADPSQKSRSIFLVAGQRYYIEALHKESSGDDHLAVGWTKPDSNAIEIIADENLAPITPTVRLFSNRPNVAEGAASPALFTILRSGTPTTNAIDVTYTVSGTATNGVDYTTLSGTATIAAGEDSVDIAVSPLADALAEGHETIVIELVQSTAYQVGLKSQRIARGTIQDDSPAPAGGTDLWNGNQLSDFVAFGGSYSTQSDPTVGSVIQAVIPTQPTQFSSQLKQNIDGPVAAGDLLLMEFDVRSIGGNGQIAAVFEQSSSPFTKSLLQGVTVSADWSKVQIPFVPETAYAAGDASGGLFLGYLNQTIQVANFRIINYGPSKSIAPETAFNLNNITGNFGVGSIVPATGQSFDFAYEVQTTTVPTQVWHLQALEQNEATIANGDTMRFEFSIRSTSGASPQASFVIQDTATYSNIFTESITPTSAWQTYSFDIDATQAFARGGIQAVFNLGFGLQTVEIGGFLWTNLENSVEFDDLPSQFPANDYGGRAGTDSWRGTAEQGIEDNRKSNVTIEVTDANGNPLDGAVVNLRQNRHAFGFGTAITNFGGRLSPTATGSSLQYQQEIKRLFNTVVAENSLKWPQYEADSARAIEEVDFATTNGLTMRGHNIIWPSRNLIPDSVWTNYDARVINDGLSSANAWLTTTIEARFDDVLNTFDGTIKDWDVVNEPFTNRAVMDILGDGIVLDWFQRVRDFDPDIKLALNDFNIFTVNGGDAAHRADFENWLGQLRDAGLLDLIGVQSHFTDAGLTDIPMLGGLIESYYTEFNAPIAITEFDLTSNDEQLQADYLRDYMTMSFSQSGIDQFLHWGFWEGAHFSPTAALYRNDFSIKPSGQAYEDLVFGEWWTDVRGTTSGGQFSTSAFLGEYDVEVQFDGVVYTGAVTVDETGASSVMINTPVTATEVLDQRIGYGGSSAFNEMASPTTVVALLPGQQATSNNYSNYLRGINRVMIDVAGLPASTLTSDDFEFRVGNTADPSDWEQLSPTSTIALPTISVVDGPVAGQDQIVLSWPDDAITNTWLQVTMKPTAATGLSANHTFYFGNQIGDINGDTSNNRVRVNAFDSVLTRLNVKSNALINDVYDINRDGRVNAFDSIFIRLNTTFAGLLMFTAPMSAAGSLSASLPQFETAALETAVVETATAEMPDALLTFDEETITEIAVSMQLEESTPAEAPAVAAPSAEAPSAEAPSVEAPSVEALLVETSRASNVLLETELPQPELDDAFAPGQFMIAQSVNESESRDPADATPERKSIEPRATLALASSIELIQQDAVFADYRTISEETEDLDDAPNQSDLKFDATTDEGSVIEI